MTRWSGWAPPRCRTPRWTPVGVSNYAAWQIAGITHTAERVGAPRPVVAQQLYNLPARRIEEVYREYAATSVLRAMVYNPLGGGLLTGRHAYARGSAPGPRTRVGTRLPHRAVRRGRRRAPPEGSSRGADRP
ncbi:aldo/keto reductase [Streptomyces sp. OE57]|uniref:aldo/keto reductase n=1 Tax=Streptomyces lacaronensis TaxID=3379885 RepID=UPI0039B76C0F